jgi:coenzyme PQQ precursor peptide PqqA
MVAGRGRLTALPHENHEANIMMLLIRRAWPPWKIGDAPSRRVEMKWETPQAIDFRFGMEITMYIANR